MVSGTLVTGGSGFVGSFVVARLRLAGLPVVGAARVADPIAGCMHAPALEEEGDWSELLAGRAVVIHTAARVHLMRDSATNPLEAYRSVNVKGTLHLAQQAAEAGVRRFVFLSSIKVNGEATEPGRPYAANDAPSPQDAYAISKAEAEVRLRALAAETGMEVVIVRPPLVYGPGVEANFLSLMRALRRGVPLPLGAVVNNRRSLVALDNLADLIVTCVDHPGAANRTILVSDGEDLSTADLLRRLAAAMGMSARLLPVPVPLLYGAATVLGRGGMMRRLCGSLQVDIAETCSVLGWKPPVSVDEGLRRAVEGFRG